MTTFDDREKAFELASLLALMDGSRITVESELLRDLRTAFDIDDWRAEELEDNAREIYERYQERKTEPPDSEG